MLHNSSPTADTPLNIDNLSHEGRGVAKYNGKVMFVQDALAGETVTVTNIRRKKQFDEAQVNTVVSPSPERIPPICEHFGMCGGCSLQHFNPTAQIKHKEQVLLEQFTHFGQTTPQQVLPPLTGPTQGYRSKARLGIKYVFKKEKLLIGFRERGGRFLTDMTHCPILAPSIMQALPAFKKTLLSLSDFKQLPQIEVAAGEDHTAFILRHLSPMLPEDLNKLTAFAREENIILFLQPKGPDSIHPLWPEDANYLTYTLPEYNLTFQFHPSDFTQVNMTINRKMIAQALDWLAPAPTEIMLDLFCGLGNFSLPLAKYYQSVVGVEGSDAMQQRASENAHLNHLSNTTFYSADLTQDHTHSPWLNTHYDAVLLDPPRTGAEALLPQLKPLMAKKILYISCNPATLARDAHILVNDMGYELVKVNVMDMFTHTAHVESMALFTRKDNV